MRGACLFFRCRWIGFEYLIHLFIRVAACPFLRLQPAECIGILSCSIIISEFLGLLPLLFCLTQAGFHNSIGREFQDAAGNNGSRFVGDKPVHCIVSDSMVFQIQLPHYTNEQGSAAVFSSICSMLFPVPALHLPSYIDFHRTCISGGLCHTLNNVLSWS